MILIILGIILFIVATLIAKNNTAIAKFEGIDKNKTYKLNDFTIDQLKELKELYFISFKII